MGTNRFISRTVTEEQSRRIDTVKCSFGGLLDVINTLIPEGREKSLMITKLEEACMWATTAISIEQAEEIEII